MEYLNTIVLIINICFQPHQLYMLICITLSQLKNLLQYLRVFIISNKEFLSDKQFQQSQIIWETSIKYYRFIRY